MKPLIRSYYSMEYRPLNNLGDALVPSLLDSLGYSYALRSSDNASVVNKNRCLLIVGSILTQRKLNEIPYPMDVWGCGWKGPKLAPSGREDIRYHAVRGPQTAAGLGLPLNIPLGDPALLVPYLIRLPIQRHGSTLVIPHMDRLKAIHAKKTCLLTGCEQILSTMVWPPSYRQILRRNLVRESLGILYRRVRYGVRVQGLWSAVSRIAGASFVLTGSLHGAILAQAYGVPWAAYDDGYVDAPAKWHDWAAYLGVEIEFVRTLEDGERWWRCHGYHGRIRSLRPLLNAFPYPILNPMARRLARELP